MTRVENKEQSILKKMEEREESLRKMERKLATERGRHLHTLKDYDNCMTTRETNLTRHEQEFDTTEAERIMGRAMQYMENAQKQTERAIKAWTEITILQLKDRIDGYQSEQKDRTDAFCQEQLQDLEAHLESCYEEQAKGIQARLCVRLQDNMAEANPPPHARSHGRGRRRNHANPKQQHYPMERCGCRRNSTQRCQQNQPGIPHGNGLSTGKSIAAKPTGEILRPRIPNQPSPQHVYTVPSPWQRP